MGGGHGKALKWERNFKKTPKKQEHFTGQREPHWGHQLRRRKALHMGFCCEDGTCCEWHILGCQVLLPASIKDRSRWEIRQAADKPDTQARGLDVHLLGEQSDNTHDKTLTMRHKTPSYTDLVIAIVRS